VLCLSSFGGGDLPSCAEGMKTCAGSRRLLLRRERWGRVLRTVHPLELGSEHDSQPFCTSPLLTSTPALVIVEGDTVSGCTPRILSLSQYVEVRASYTSPARVYYIYIYIYLHTYTYIYVYIYMCVCVFVYIGIYICTYRYIYYPSAIPRADAPLYVLPGSLTALGIQATLVSASDLADLLLS